MCIDAPFYLYLVAPDGRIAGKYINRSSGTVTVAFTDFSGCSAYGAWKVYIVGKDCATAKVFLGFNYQ